MRLKKFNTKSERYSKVEFLTPRYQSGTTIELKLTNKGWEIKTIALNTEHSGPNGKPFLYQYLNHDSIPFSNSLPDVMEELWKKAHLENFDDDRLQRSLSKIAKWINDCNSSEPIFELTKRTREFIRK